MLALLGAGKALLSRPVRGLRYAAEASFPFYVLHQTVIVAVAYVVVAWDLEVWQKFTTVGLAALALTLVAYEVAVRRSSNLVPGSCFGMRSRRPQPRTTTPTLALPRATSRHGAPLRGRWRGRCGSGSRPHRRIARRWQGNSRWPGGHAVAGSGGWRLALSGSSS